MPLKISDINIQDFYTRKRIVDAKVEFLRADSSLLSEAKVGYSTSVINGVKRYEEGSAFIPYCTDLIVRITKEGYDPVMLTLQIPEKEIIKEEDRIYEWNKMPKILISRSIKTQHLKEATVVASRLQMVVKGDTLEYNVANLQLSAGSMLENLIRNLPGAQLDNNGRITVNGEFVNRLLVNGRDFFNGDVMVALKNLPYYTVGKIQVYHDIGRYFKNEQDSLRALAHANLTMNVKLKKIYSQSWIANMELGGGSRTHTNWKNVYFGRFFALRFTDHSHLGIYGIANNVGKNYQATHSGSWREMKAYGGGEPITQSGGINFAVDGKKTQVHFNTSLNVVREKNEMQEKISSQYFIGNGDIFDRSRRLNHDRSFNVNWNAQISKSTRNYNFSIRPDFLYNEGRGWSESLGASFNGDPMDSYRTASLDSIFGDNPSQHLTQILIRDNQFRSRSSNSWLMTSLDAQLGLRMPGTKNHLTLEAFTAYRRAKMKAITFSEVQDKEKRYNSNLFNTSPEEYFNYRLAASYPIFSTNPRRRVSVNSTLKYQFEHLYRSNERQIYKDESPMPEEVPDMNTGYAWEYNLRNSFLTDQYEDVHTVNWSLYWLFPGIKKGSYVTVNLNLPFKANNREVVDLRNHREQRCQKTSCYLTPYLQISALNYRLFGQYSRDVRLPDLNDMLDFYDDAYALYRTVGNPHLQPQYTHNFNLNWGSNNRKKAQWLKLEWNHAIIENQQTMARTYDRKTGITTSQRTNIDGNWWTTGRISFGRALDKHKFLNFSSSAYYTFANSVDYSNDQEVATLQRYKVKNNRMGASASLAFAKKEFRVALNGSVTWNGLRSHEASFTDMNYTDMYYTLSLTTPLIWNIHFDTDLNLNLRRGYHEPSMNTTEWIWNASLSRALDRQGRWVMRAVAFDLLHNLSNVRNTINAQGHTERWLSVVQSYASLHLVYHFKVKPIKKGIAAE